MHFSIMNSSTSGSNKKWGADVIKRGYTTVPNLLLLHQVKLDISCLELAVLLHVFRHWWQPEDLPFPSNGRLAALLGLSARQVQRHIAALEKKGLVKRIVRKSQSGGRTSNSLDPEGLVCRLAELAHGSPPHVAESELVVRVG